MIRLPKNIALVLIGIFILPIAFQSVHIVWHQSHGFHGNATCCHVDLSKEPCCSDAKAGVKIFDQKDAHCPICEYRFAINDLPNVTIYRTTIPVMKLSTTELETKLPFQQVLSTKSPRAPPARF